MTARPCLRLKVTLNLMDKDVSRPATLDSLPDIPVSFRGGLDHFENPHVVPPGQLCDGLLHKLLIGVGFGESPHIFEVSRAKPSHPRKSLEQVMSQPSRPPLLSTLPIAGRVRMSLPMPQ